MAEETQPPPRLTGVVIIQLPPPDNPSAGKTITAFTVTEDDYHGGYPQLQQQDNHPSSTTLQEEEEEEVGGGGSRLPVQRPIPTRLPYPRIFLGISLCAVLIYASLFSDTLQEELKRSSNDDDQGRRSFLLPLYNKLASPPVFEKGIEHTVGRLVYKENSVALIDRPIITPLKVNKLPSSSSSTAAKVGVDTSPIFPVKGNIFPDGFYYTYILLGSPPRPYFLDIDTGSDLSWIQCDAPCTSCAKGANDLYKPKTSNIVLPEDSYCLEVQRNTKAEKCNACKQCDYEIEYADHSSSLGVLANDELHLSSENESSKSKFTFGCAYDQQGFLLNTLASTDGILGLSRAKVSFPSQLASQGIITNVVGHCLTTDVSGGGYMFLGDEFLPQRGVRWVPMLDIPFTDFYQTEIMKLTYGRSILSLGGKGDRPRRVVFDSGSSFTYLTTDAYSELVASLKEVARAGLIQDTSDLSMPLCWRAESPIRSVADVKQYFKTLTLQFGSKWWIISRTFRVPPEGYLIISEKGNVCLGILDGSKLLDGSTMILGGTCLMNSIMPWNFLLFCRKIELTGSLIAYMKLDISMRGKLVVYDNEKKRIGWMPSDCVKPRRHDQLPLFEG